jgi:hypothetical protein
VKFCSFVQSRVESTKVAEFYSWAYIFSSFFGLSRDALVFSGSGVTWFSCTMCKISGFPMRLGCKCVLAVSLAALTTLSVHETMSVFFARLRIPKRVG